MKSLREFWSDAVGSKVIAAAIIAILSTLILGCYSLITTKPFFDLLIEFLSLKIALWIVLLFAVLISIIYFIVRPKPILTASTASNRTVKYG